MLGGLAFLSVCGWALVVDDATAEEGELCLCVWVGGG